MTVTEKLNGYGPLAGIKVGRDVHVRRSSRQPSEYCPKWAPKFMKIESFDGDIQRTQGPGFGCDLTDTEDPHHRPQQHQQELDLPQLEGSRGRSGHREEDDRRSRHLHEQHAHGRPGEARASTTRRCHAEFPGLIWGSDARLRRVRRVRPLPPATMPCAGPPAAAWRAPSPRRARRRPFLPQAFGDYNTATMMAAGHLGRAGEQAAHGPGATRWSSNLYHSAIWGGCIGRVRAAVRRRLPEVAHGRAEPASTTRTRRRTASGSTSASRSTTATTTT